MPTPYAEKIEALVDERFAAQAMLKIPFCTLYNAVSQMLTVNFATEGFLDIGMLQPFYFIIERIEDFSLMSLEESISSLEKIKSIGFNQAIQCATLHIVFPLIHRGLYSIEPDGEQASRIKYTNDHFARLDSRDVLLTNDSLPFVAIKRNLSLEYVKASARRLKRGESLRPRKAIREMKAYYADDGLIYKEMALVPDELFIQLGFSSAEIFRKIRRAFVALSEVYIGAARLVTLYYTKNNLIAPDDFLLGISMEKMSREELYSIINEICKTEKKDLFNFLDFFTGNAKNKKISNSFMPPFWEIDDQIYFIPCTLNQLLGQRNLLISIQNHPTKRAKYKFDEKISSHFEPTLLRNAQNLFEKFGFATKTECKFLDRSIDLAIYCKKSNTILTIQAKATLPPESARMVDRLESRVNEGIDQIEYFDKNDPDTQGENFNNWFPEAKIVDANHIRGILVNSSFGSFSTWTRLESMSIVPLNPHMLHVVLQKCATLAELPTKISSYIDEIEKSSERVIEEKVFHIGTHTIKQDNYDHKGARRQFENTAESYLFS